MSYSKYFTFEECDGDTAEFYQIIHNHTVCIEKRYIEYDGQLLELAQNIDQVIYVAVREKMNDPDPEVTTEFLQFHYEKYLADHGTGRHFLTFLRKNIWKYGLPDQRTETIETWIDAKIKELEPNDKDRATTGHQDKIKWKGTPSQFGYLVAQLIEKGFIDPPLFNGDINFSELSRRCYQYFDIDTTLGNLTKEMNPSKCTLSDTKRAKFTIPNLSDLA